MQIASILSHTPTWVWTLLAYLLWRGVRALRAREISPSRTLVLPMIFLAWALFGMFAELSNWAAALMAFIIGIGIGFSGGWTNATRLPPASFNRTSGLVWRPGSATTLVLVIVAFVTKYLLSVALAMHPDLGADTGFAAVFGGISGLVDGAFWGGTVQQFRSAFAARAVSA
ncbi:DUF6622 family protein [Solirhodobacter olei]|uniref:DUF6622 family protein n=1 Tax=Solirhodobacter olei TaxID=2493082 RepID=UPI000FDB230F|nr:DUF6622 family protein [Solirhodobacter olei]